MFRLSSSFMYATYKPTAQMPGIPGDLAFEVGRLTIECWKEPVDSRESDFCTARQVYQPTSNPKPPKTSREYFFACVTEQQALVRPVYQSYDIN